jgi:hypothetical protein
MPTQKTITEKYWGWRKKWGWFYYPCKKTREVTKWCYDFCWIKARYYLFLVHYTACENDEKYTWWEGCLNLFGSKWYYNTWRCFKGKKSGNGTCSCD